MKYLVNESKPSTRAHIWDEGDTYCQMYSTGGMRKKRYRVIDDAGDRQVCLMCENNYKRFHEFTKSGVEMKLD